MIYNKKYIELAEKSFVFFHEILYIWFLSHFWHRAPKTLGIPRDENNKSVPCYVNEVIFGKHLRLGAGCQEHQAVLTLAAHILKIGTIQRRLAWPLRKDDTQIREAFHIFGQSEPVSAQARALLAPDTFPTNLNSEVQEVCS